MARTDWVAIQTDPAAEYTARVELERLGLTPYLPQIRRRWRPARSTAVMVRLYHVFPTYIFLPIRSSDAPAVRLARGVRRVKPVLCDSEGRLWRCPEAVVDAVRETEAAGGYDEALGPGDSVRLTFCSMAAEG
jgi:hypothetical protein